MTKIRIASAGWAAGLALLSQAASADEGITLKAGAIDIVPHSSFTPLSGEFLPVNALGLHAREQTTLFLGASHDLGDHLQVDLVGGIPPKHDIQLVVLDRSAVTPAIAAQNGAVVAKVTQFAPNLLLNYRFGDSSAVVRPYLGAGVNYTRFIHTESTATNDALSGGPTHIHLTSSFGPAAQAGALVKVNERWSLVADWLTARVKSKVTNNTLGVVSTSRVTFRAQAFTLAAAYGF